jgi:hypothetical protein
LRVLGNLALCLATGWVAGPLAAQEAGSPTPAAQAPAAAAPVSAVRAVRGLSARHHAWGRFQPGAWKVVRVVTETLDPAGLVSSTSTTETKTTLAKLGDDGVCLEVEVGVEVAGKQLDAQPQFINQGFHGELSGPGVVIKPAGASQVLIEDRQIDCRLQQVEFAGPSSRTVESIYYSDLLPPYVLKRASTTTDSSGQQWLGETTQEVLALDLPYKVLAVTKTAACVRTVQRDSRGMIVSVAMTANDVPGGVVYQTSKETDKAGRLARRSTLELVGYGLRAEEERPGLFGRKRAARIRNKSALHAPYRADDSN